MKNVCVFCSANEVDKIYVMDAFEIARLIANNGFGLVWGGTDRGLMKVIADAVEENGGKLTAVSVDLLAPVCRKRTDELIIVKSISERKAALIEKGDAIILLVGGLGSLDEVTEILELKKHNLCSKPVVVLNTNGFYDDFKNQLIRMKEEGFIKKKLDELIYFADTPKMAVEYINDSLVATD